MSTVAAAVKKWRCLGCKSKNRLSRSVCRNCGLTKGSVSLVVDTDMREKVNSLLSKVDVNLPRQRVPLDSVEPNNWNPNKMAQDKKDKLWRGMQNVLEQSGHLPSIWVRPHPRPHGKIKWQIIDGEQRWTILSDHQDSEIVKKYLDGMIDIEIYHVDTKVAKVLTSSGNWLRGEVDPDEYADYLRGLLRDEHMTIEEAASVLPETVDEITSYAEAYDIHLSDPEVPDDSESSDSETKDEDVFIEYRCVLSKAAHKVVVGEMNRIGAMLKERNGSAGKNIQGRALEFMAVLSSQTPPESVSGMMEDPEEPDFTEEEEEELPRPKKKKRKEVKDSLRAKAGRVA